VQKRKLAKELGADFVFNPGEKGIQNKVPELTKKRGADFGFEVVGITDSVQTCINSLRKGGTAVLVGNLSPEISFPLQKVVTREIKILGSCAINGEYEMVLDLLSSKKINIKNLLSAVVPLSEGASWFNRLYNKEPGLNKVILVPDSEFHSRS
jgi:L-iditol 2-dehydrogenase